MNGDGVHNELYSSQLKKVIIMWILTVINVILLFILAILIYKKTNRNLTLVLAIICAISSIFNLIWG